MGDVGILGGHTQLRVGLVPMSAQDEIHESDRGFMPHDHSDTDSSRICLYSV